MYEISDGKLVHVAEVGLITCISKVHRPNDGQVVYSLTIISQFGQVMVPMQKELFEQWILGMNRAISELDGNRIEIPRNFTTAKSN